jgi:hypothetical protein
MSNFSTITVNGNGAAVPIVSAGDGPVMVVNESSANIVYVGKDPAASPNNLGNTGPLLPGANMTFTGDETWYGVCASGLTAIVTIWPGTTVVTGVY